MPKSFAYHPRFAQAIPPWREIVGGTSLVAIKRERHEFAGVPRIGVDIMIRSEAGLHVILLAELEDTRILVPEPYRVAHESVAHIIAAVETWFDQHRDELLPSLTLFDAAPDIVRIANDINAPIVPGLSTYDRIFDACDRYRAVVPLAAGRHVVDFSGGSGYGTHLLRPFAASLRLGADAPENIDLALGYVQRGNTSPVGVALHLGLDAARVPTSLEAARVLSMEAPIVAISALGPAGKIAIDALGIDGMPIARLGNDTLPPLDEMLAVVAPPPPASVEVTMPPLSVTAAERSLRVLFALRMSAENIFGGDVVQVRMTVAALRARGHDVQITTKPTFDPSGFDIVHFSNLTSVYETLEQMKSVEQFAGPIVMMPIFTDHADETVWGMRSQGPIFSSINSSEDLHNVLESFAHRKVTLGQPGAPDAIVADKRGEMVPGYYDMQREITRRSDYFIANAHAEMHRVYRFLDPTIPYAIAPSAADPSTYHPDAALAFREKYAFGDFVLLPGRFEPRKNQIMLMEALRRSGRRLVLIGRCFEGWYGNLMRAYLGPNVIVMAHVPEPTLAGALAAARLVVLPSFDEVVSLTALNAAACGASLVLTRQSYEHEYLRDDAEYCDPVDVNSISSAVDRAWNLHGERAERRAELSARVRREYTWDRAAECTEQAYYRVLASNPRGRARLARG